MFWQTAILVCNKQGNADAICSHQIRECHILSHRTYVEPCPLSSMLVIRWTRNFEPVLVSCWANVCDVVPTWNQHRLSMFYVFSPALDSTMAQLSLQCSWVAYWLPMDCSKSLALSFKLNDPSSCVCIIQSPLVNDPLRWWAFNNFFPVIYQPHNVGHPLWIRGTYLQLHIVTDTFLCSWGVMMVWESCLQPFVIMTAHDYIVILIHMNIYMNIYMNSDSVIQEK